MGRPAAALVTSPVPGPLSVVTLDAFCDASSGSGVAVVVGDRWRAWRLLPGWQANGRDIGWAEAVGFELLARTVLTLPGRPAAFCLQCDNQGVVEAWRKGFSRNAAVMPEHNI